MVIYTYVIPKLFFLHFLIGLAELLEGMAAVLTFGCVRLGISYNILFKLSSLEMRMRMEKKKRRKNDTWPRLCIWPREEK